MASDREAPCPICAGRGYVAGLAGLHWCACPLGEECRRIAGDAPDQRGEG